MSALSTDTSTHATDRRPLTASERPIFASQELNPGRPLFNMAVAVEVPEPLDPGALRNALRHVVAGADALRTVVQSEGGVPFATVLPEVEPTLDVVDLPDDAWQDGSLRRRLEARARAPLPLDRPMFDVALFRGVRRSTLFINQHHLIADAASVGVLHRRLSAAYERTSRGEVPEDADEPQFMAYVQHLQGRPTHPSGRPGDTPGAAPAPGPDGLRFYGREPDGRGRTRRVPVALGPERLRVLERLTALPEFRGFSVEQSRLTVLATVLGAWLARATDRREVVIGVPVHHRTAAAFRDTVGLFMEVSALRLDVDPGGSFRTLAARVREATQETLRNAVPGADQPPGGHTFGAVLNVITAELGRFAGRPVTTEWLHPGFGDPAHAVRAQIHDFDGSGTPSLALDLDESVFGPVERGWAVEHVLTLFDALARDLDAGPDHVALVSPEEEERFAPRGARVPLETGLLAAFGAVVDAYGDEVAVFEGDDRVTYRELSARARAVAAALHAAGEAGDGAVVGVAMERGADQVAALLGVARAGAAYLPLDPAHPDERLAMQLRDAGARIVLTGPAFEARVRSWGVAPMVRRGAPAQGGTADPKGAAWVDPPPDRLAYVLYTSGSTGRPKGVEVTHGALAEYVAWAARTYDRGEALRWAWFTSPAYDLTVTSIFTPLVSGGSIVVHRDPPDGARLTVLDVFADPRVQAVKLTPSHLALLGSLDLSRSRVRRLVLGGENLPTSSARAAAEAFGPDTVIYNEYGPTEATVGCMVHRYDLDRDTGPSVPIGAPADNVSIHVLGPGGTPALRGESGEICIAGPRLARGYRGLPERTAEAFVDHPGTPGGRLYRTGDRGRWRPDGVLEYLGRDDDQVKVGGIRLELGEAEAALARHSRVRHAAVRIVEAGRVDGERRCRTCGIEAAHPEARIGDDGRCSLCVRFEGERDAVARYFGTVDDLRSRLAEAGARSRGPQDVIMLYSGGKDSTYALCRIVEMGARPLVFLLDNGFISDQAKENARRVVELLDLELVIGSTPAMPAIFAESLRRFSNVCQGCFKTIYNLALNLAVERGIGAIVTGLSRGQIFETRLADLYRRRIYEPEAVDRIIDEARRAYHRMDDAPAGVLATGSLSLDEVLDRVGFIDFYRYCDVELEELLAYLGERTPWIRPSDTGRSTNCLINDAGIHVHRAERGFHNYSLPYSWDVRLGHKDRDAAVAELEDDLEPARIRRMLDRVGYRERPAPPPETRLAAYYVADEEIPVAELRRAMAEVLPTPVLPSVFVRLDALPLADSGKVRRDALPLPGSERPSVGTPFVAPETDVERRLAGIWAEVLGLERVGVHDDFFELGGESMRCIQIAAVARDRGLRFTPNDLFRNPTVAALAPLAALDESPALAPAEVDGAELDRLRREFGG